jgi:hypothetical protein
MEKAAVALNVAATGHFDLGVDLGPGKLFKKTRVAKPYLLYTNPGLAFPKSLGSRSGFGS